MRETGPQLESSMRHQVMTIWGWSGLCLVRRSRNGTLGPSLWKSLFRGETVEAGEWAREGLGNPEMWPDFLEITPLIWTAAALRIHLNGNRGSRTGLIIITVVVNNRLRSRLLLVPLLPKYNKNSAKPVNVLYL